jgi:hypothetical protein
MYQFSEQLNNAIAPVDSIFASVAFYELSVAYRATAFGDPYGCDIPKRSIGGAWKFFQHSRNRTRS